MFKEAAFEPSSPVRHSAELYKIIKRTNSEKPVLFIYSDGGPDYRVNFMSVKLALIALYRKLDLDYLCAARTALYHSYRNPVERMMSIVNLGLQAVALAREKMPEEMEAEASKCNSLKNLRALAEWNAEFRVASKDSIAPVKILLTDIAQRLELKEKKFVVYTAAPLYELDALWMTILAIDKEFRVNHTDKSSAKDLIESLCGFMSHCCAQRHYFFDTLKCGKEGVICLPPRPCTTYQILIRVRTTIINLFPMCLEKTPVSSIVHL